MGITYGDYLIDSGYYEPTPEDERKMDDQTQQKNDLDKRRIVIPW